MRKFFCLLLFVLSYSFLNAQSAKIPIDAARWYQLNNVTGGLGKLFDGSTASAYSPGWSTLLSPYEAYYPLLAGEQMTVDSLRMYDREGVYTSTPVYIYAINDNWERKLIGTFWGDKYLAWVGPYPTRPNVFKLDTAVGNIRYLMLKVCGVGFPAELELYGSYTPPSAQPPVQQQPGEPLKRMFGVDGFAWNFVKQQGSAITIDSLKMKALKSFGAFRQYLDWQKSEPLEGRYYFSPQDGGGWPLDTIYKTAQSADLEMVATIQSIPNWMVATYPDSLKSSDNNPVRYGKNLSDPASYTEQAKLGFQFAARYGRSYVDSSLVSVYTVPPWPNAQVNQKKIALGTVRYVECGNEVDKTWRGRKGYMSGREYAANLSAFYDGHKGSLGPGVGVKTADSTMLVVMSGLALPSTDYYRGIVDWCKEFRGLKPDGRIDLCFDVINYHYYSSDRGVFQTASGTRGLAPEKSQCDSIARSFVATSRMYAYNTPVWVSEQGYDINQSSTLKAIPVGSRTAAQTQADWTLRSGLLYARAGLQKSFFYEVFDVDVSSSTKYASMGLIDKNTLARKPAADFVFQVVQQFGEYRYQETLNSNPFVDRYAWNGKSMFALVVPDEVGRTAAYDLVMSGADSAIIYTPTIGSDTMTQQKVATNGGTLSVLVTETPVFVVPVYSSMTDAPQNNASALVNDNETLQQTSLHIKQTFQSRGTNEKKNVFIFPNPAKDQVRILNQGGGKWKVVLLDLKGTKLQEVALSGDSATIHLQRILPGIYPLYILDESGAMIAGEFLIKQ